MSTIDDEEVIASTTAWLEQMVIGLNLCPFAKAIHLANQIRFVVSPATTSRQLTDALKKELAFLIATEPAIVESTLLIHPNALVDFDDYNSFLELANLILEEMGIEQEIQIASFHPHYRFADTAYEESSNYSNRSPYPTLHLLREKSVEQAIASIRNPEGIYERNIATLSKLGKEQLDAMMAKYQR